MYSRMLNLMQVNGLSFAEPNNSNEGGEKSPPYFYIGVHYDYKGYYKAIQCVTCW